MTDPTPPPAAVAPTVEPPRRRLPSIVWLIPLLTVLAAMALLVQTMSSRGPKITIAFDTASGIVAGQTTLRFRDVVVGEVKRVRFAEDLSDVLVEVQLDPTVEPFIDSEAKFWVVSPQVSAEGISGLETVLSGSYIQGSWDSVAGPAQRFFVAETGPPPTPDGTPGKRIVLRAPDGGSLSVGAPILFKRVEVGRVEAKRLTPDGSAVEFDAFIAAPHDERITEATRFWNVSGVSVDLGLEGARLNIESLSSLIRGGASFDTFGGAADTVPSGHVFTLHPTPQAAQEDATLGPIAGEVPVETAFDVSVRGLRAGAPVELGGITVGRVTAVNIQSMASGRFSTRVTLALSPTRLGLSVAPDAPPERAAAAVVTFLEAAVQQGMRARLALGNLLTGALYVELVELPPGAQDDAVLDVSGAVPQMPSVEADLEAISGSVSGILDRLDALPIEALLNNTVTLLENINQLASDPATRALPAETQALIAQATATMQDPAIARTLAGVDRLVGQLNTLAADPAVAGAPAQVAALLDSVNALLATLEEAGTAGDIAATVAALRTLAEDPATLALPARATATLDAATALLQNPAVLETPGKIAAVLDTLTARLDDPALAALPREVQATLATLRGRIEDPALTAALAEAQPLLAEARTTLTRLRAGADPVLANLASILGDPGTQALPGEATAALAAARALLQEPATRATIGEAGATLAALRALLEQPSTKAAPQELAATLAAARSLVQTLVDADAAGELAATLKASRALVADPALRALAAESERTLAAIRAVLSAPGADRLPAATATVLQEAGLLMAQFRAENLGQAATGALAGVGAATGELSRALAGLPALIARMTSVASRADRLLQELETGSEVNYEAMAALRDIRDAARAVTDLADLVQQQPNALILGK
ncbi:MAG: MlaD family protein [Pseudomonadota bacterium]